MITPLLVVNVFSYKYVTQLTHYIHGMLQLHYGNVRIEICNTVDEAKIITETVVYVIGDPFEAFFRTPGCRYIFINFSVLYELGDGDDEHDKAARYLIQNKYDSFKRKLYLYDFILDFYPKQTIVMARDIALPVRSFPIGVPIQAVQQNRLLPPLYDICFVGSMSPRREALLTRFKQAGLRLSPQNNVIFEEVASVSQIALNVHMHKSNHLEYPRIVSSLASSAALVTEKSYGMNEEFPSDLFVQGKYDDLFSLTIQLLSDLPAAERLSLRARSWMQDTYVPKSIEQWLEVLADVDKTPSCSV